MSSTGQQQKLARPANSNVPEPPMAPIKAPSYRGFPRPPKSNITAFIVAGLSMAAILAVLALAPWVGLK
jgi:hypothetical protein